MISGTAYLAMTWGPAALVGLIAFMLLIRNCGWRARRRIQPKNVKVMCIAGPSGVGKTDAIEQFLDETPGRRQTTWVVQYANFNEQTLVDAEKSKIELIIVEGTFIDPVSFPCKATWVVMEYDRMPKQILEIPNFIDDWVRCVKRIDQHAEPMAYHILMWDGHVRMEDEKIQECLESILHLM